MAEKRFLNHMPQLNVLRIDKNKIEFQLEGTYDDHLVQLQSSFFHLIYHIILLELQAIKPAG